MVLLEIDSKQSRFDKLEVTLKLRSEILNLFVVAEMFAVTQAFAQPENQAKQSEAI